MGGCEPRIEVVKMQKKVRGSGRGVRTEGVRVRCDPKNEIIVKMQKSRGGFGRGGGGRRGWGWVKGVG